MCSGCCCCGSLAEPLNHSAAALWRQGVFLSSQDAGLSYGVVCGVDVCTFLLWAGTVYGLRCVFGSTFGSNCFCYGRNWQQQLLDACGYQAHQLPTCAKPAGIRRHTDSKPVCNFINHQPWCLLGLVWVMDLGDNRARCR